MRTPVVIVIHIGSKYPAKMPLMQHDHMVERVTPNAADYPLTVWILPGRSRGNLDLFNAQVLDALLERCAVDRVPIPQQIARCRIPGKGLDDLLGRRVFSHIEM